MRRFVFPAGEKEVETLKKVIHCERLKLLFLYLILMTISVKDLNRRY